MNGCLKLIAAGLKTFRRDRPAVFWSFFFPLFFIVMFGSIFGRSGAGPDKLPIGVVMQDASPQARWIPGAFGRVFSVHEGTAAEEEAALRKGSVRAVVVFPAGAAQRLFARQPVKATVYYDPTQPQISPIVLGIVRQVLAGINQRIEGTQPLLSGSEQPLGPSTRGGAAPSGIDFLLPGIVAMSIMQLGLFTAIPLINLREKGILKRLQATPLKRPTFVASQISVRLVISLVQTLIIVAAGALLFNFRVQGSWLASGALVVLGVLTFVAMGTVLSSVAKTAESGAPLVQLVMLPMLFLSGLLFTVDVLPPFLRSFSRLLPTTYLGDALRSTMLSAPSSYGMGLDMAVLAGWLLSMSLLAARTFRWE